MDNFDFLRNMHKNQGTLSAEQFVKKNNNPKKVQKKESRYPMLNEKIDFTDLKSINKYLYSIVIWAGYGGIGLLGLSFFDFTIRSYLIINYIFIFIMCLALKKYREPFIVLAIFLYSAFSIFIAALLSYMLQSFYLDYPSALYRSDGNGFSLEGIFFVTIMALALKAAISIIKYERFCNIKINWANFFIKTLAAITCSGTFIKFYIDFYMKTHLFDLVYFLNFGCIGIIVFCYLAYSGFFPWGNHFRIKNLNQENKM